MRKQALYLTIGLLAAIVVSIYSCKKLNGIDNGQVIETPYSLYLSDTSGALFCSTDGRNKKLVFTADGKPCRALITSGSNILWAKNNLYLSENNGLNFNGTYDSLPFHPVTAVNGYPLELNQSMILNTASGRVYCASAAFLTADGGGPNYLGTIHSDAHGARGSWGSEGYDTGAVGRMPVHIWTLTQMRDGTICGLGYGQHLYDTFHIRNLYILPNDSLWRETTANPDNISDIYHGNLTGTPLPPHATLHDTAFFTLGHFNNRLIAIDNKGKYGAWYSDDRGANWAQYSGLPANRPLLCISSPFEEVCLIGTDSAGLYVLNVNGQGVAVSTDGIWQQNNNGLGKYLVVRNIAFKENVYKNGTVQKYIYLATNQGIYQSSDGGINWTMTIPGNYVAVY